MALIEERYRDLVNAVHHDDFDKFKDELSKVGKDGYHPSKCLYAKTQDNVVHVIAQLGRVRFLLELMKTSKELLEVMNVDGKTPLHEAAQFSQVEIVRILLENGVKIDPLKRADWTPLMLACTKGGHESLQIILELLNHGADMNLQNKDGWTPFHLASREGDEKILKALIQKAPKAALTKSKNGRTPLHTASLHGRLEAVKLIVKGSPELAVQKDSCGALPILDSVRGGQIEILQFLSEINPPLLFEPDIMDRNCLHVAAQSGHINIIEKLVNEKNMDPNDGSNLTTPLHWAAKEGQVASVSKLLELGANAKAEDSNQRTPLALAIGGHHVQAAKVLVNHDQLAPFDLSVLSLAQTLAMKEMLVSAFQSNWNLTLILPGTH